MNRYLKRRCVANFHFLSGHSRASTPELQNILTRTGLHHVKCMPLLEEARRKCCRNSIVSIKHRLLCLPFSVQIFESPVLELVVQGDDFEQLLKNVDMTYFCLKAVGAQHMFQLLGYRSPSRQKT